MLHFGTKNEHEQSDKNATGLSKSSQRWLQQPIKPGRNITRTPYKVLDAPELQDDFYLNLVDWSASNFLGVGLGSSVYVGFM